MFFAVRPILLIHGKEIFTVHSRMAKPRRTATAFFPVVGGSSRYAPRTHVAPMDGRTPRAQASRVLMFPRVVFFL
jgi:hypothetical protein